MQPSTTWMTKSLTPQAFKSYCVYQIYPASFADSNGDGMGDLNGIKSKLEYIRSLGTDVVWLSPIYRSPQKDMGYDISDYQDIDPKYGTLEQWDDLVAETHRLDIRLVWAYPSLKHLIRPTSICSISSMDLVVNHTSDQVCKWSRPGWLLLISSKHAWFKESRSSKSSPKRNWYMWRPPRFDSEGRRKPPNNWASLFGGVFLLFAEIYTNLNLKALHGSGMKLLRNTTFISLWKNSLISTGITQKCGRLSGKWCVGGWTKAATASELVELVMA